MKISSLLLHEKGDNPLDARRYLARVNPVIREKSWRTSWAVSPHERLRLRAIADALVANMYGLSVDDYLWIIRDCDLPQGSIGDEIVRKRMNPKGFWRVDKDLLPEVRQTVLSAIAFQDLCEMGAEAFVTQNHGSGWMIPDYLCLADYRLGHDGRAKLSQPVASTLGPRYLEWQLREDVDISWKECHVRSELLDRVFASASTCSTSSSPKLSTSQDLVDGRQQGLF